ncbi:hypothetical protein FQA39_LY08011 [Lamprigera yunnana]|nr:hypothetical protein FQA39_LY08011 [Lamprigera yunnana]
MKVIMFSIVCIFSVVFAETVEDKKAKLVSQWEDMIAPHKATCIAESGVNESDALNCLQTMKFPDNHEFKCYAKCMQIKLGHMDAYGNFDINASASSPSGSQKIAEECILEVPEGSDICTRGYTYAICNIRRIIEGLKED